MQIEEIDSSELNEQLKRNPDDLFVLDVREIDERAICSIEPSVLIPMQQVPDRLDQLPKDKLLVVYCHSGRRSMQVALYLAQHGYPLDRLRNLHGGIDAWARTVDPTMARY